MVQANIQYSVSIQSISQYYSLTIESVITRPGAPPSSLLEGKIFTTTKGKLGVNLL